MQRRVVVTGSGLVSCVGEGPEVHLRALREGRLAATAPERHTSYPIHPVAPLDLDRQIPKRSDQRQMEPWQRLGVYAAGLALESAGAKDDAALKARMQLIVAAGGGERDYAVDEQVLTGLGGAPDPGAFLNARLTGDLRPTLFLAQLSNLLAGNIAIVHGVTGASRTFMGEEQSGVDALRVAVARIRAGQAEIMLVGGSYNAERPDVVLIHALGHFLWTSAFRPVRERPADGGGFILGSGAAFLVLEAEEHAAARNARAFARLHPVTVARTRRRAGDVAAALTTMWREMAPDGPAVVLSAATGVAGPTEEEGEALARLAPAARVHHVGDLFGHLLEAGAPAAAVLATALVADGHCEEVIATLIGHRRGEGLLRVTPAGSGQP